MDKKNIIDISKQERVVFVDNLTNEEARGLSETYPFGIFFASKANPNDSEFSPAIYLAGKCYTKVLKVDKTKINVNGFSVGLTIDEYGVLRLTNEFDIYYIGSESDVQDQSIINDSDLVSDAYRFGWHNLSGNVSSYEVNPLNISDINDFCVILPIDYTLALKIYNADSEYTDTSRLSVEMYNDTGIGDGTFNKTSITINGKLYNKYKFIGNIEPKRFINYIMKIN